MTDQHYKHKQIRYMIKFEVNGRQGSKFLINGQSFHHTFFLPLLTINVLLNLEIVGKFTANTIFFSFRIFQPEFVKGTSANHLERYVLMSCSCGNYLASSVQINNHYLNLSS